jgi:hypothetical protein
MDMLRRWCGRCIDVTLEDELCGVGVYERNLLSLIEGRFIPFFL